MKCKLRKWRVVSQTSQYNGKLIQDRLMKWQIGVKTRLIKVGGILSRSELIKRQNDETKIDEKTG